MDLTDPTQTALLVAALSVALVHTFVGVDHYLPFVVLGKARGWPLRKVVGITALCGAGHVVGSILLGAIGIGIGTAVGRLEWIESVRGSLAAWGLIAFGLVYMSWAFVRARRNERHTHPHAHHDGSVHLHNHNHHREHLHAHAVPAQMKLAPPGKVAASAPKLAAPISLTFWGMFVVFALGPCEPLIPVLMAPAFEQNWGLVLAVAALFSVATIGTMVAMATLGTLGLRWAAFDGKKAERWGNVLAGAAITLSGLAIQVLGI